MNPARDEFLRRIREDLPYSDHARRAVESAFHLDDVVQGHKTQLAADNRFSDIARQQQLAEFVRTEVLKQFASSTRPGRDAAAGN